MPIYSLANKTEEIVYVGELNGDCVRGTFDKITGRR